MNIDEKIFTCIDNFDFKMVSEICAQYEITHNQSLRVLSANEMRQMAIKELAECYRQLEKIPIDADDEVCITNGRFNFVCYREDDEYHFLMEFMLATSLSFRNTES